MTWSPELIASGSECLLQRAMASGESIGIVRCCSFIDPAIQHIGTKALCSKKVSSLALGGSVRPNGCFQEHPATRNFLAAECGEEEFHGSLGY
jgi:hypothetical protein